jgi:sulfofructose kinase
MQAKSMESKHQFTDICIIARDFAEHYTQQTEVRKAAERLLEEGPSLVVITDGTRGSWIYPHFSDAL